MALGLLNENIVLNNTFGLKESIKIKTINAKFNLMETSGNMEISGMFFINIPATPQPKAVSNAALNPI